MSNGASCANDFSKHFLKPFTYIENCLAVDNWKSIVDYSLIADYEHNPSTPHLYNCNYVCPEFINWITPLIERIYSVSVRGHTGHSLQQFSSGHGLGAHQDDIIPNGDSRDFMPNVSVVYYINDNYIGGDICFSRTNPRLVEPIEHINPFDGNIKLKPTANSCIIFDSMLWHWVLPVVSGTRYSYAMFFDAN